MTDRGSLARQLAKSVAQERVLPLGERATAASDADLDLVATLLNAAAEADSLELQRGLRGRITRVVLDTWSFQAPLSNELITFDDRYLAPAR